VDLSRTFAAGSSMGGSGSLMLAIRYPEDIAWALSWVGIHRPSMSPTFFRSYQQVYGDPAWGVKFEDGTPVWEYYDDVVYLRRHPEKEIGFLAFSNGKNDNDIGWRQAVDFVNALRETKRPFLFKWGQNGHGERATMPVDGGEREMPIDIVVNRTIPAFTNGSLDNNPGNGSPDDGEPQGQINRWVLWNPKDSIDRPDRWEMTIGLAVGSPANSATVDVTPRRCQAFKIVAGERVHWSNVRGQRILQSGEAIADQFGLVTIPQVTVSADHSRLVITRAPAAK
jgi:pimeloyl-ACP methyl ester carboxylesterase